MKKKLIFLTTALLLSMMNVNAQQITLSKSLVTAIDAALAQNRDLANHYLEIEKLELQRKGVLNKYIPQVSATTIYGYVDNTLTLDLPTVPLPIPGAALFSGNQKIDNSGNLFFGGLTAKAVLFSGGQIANGAKALEAKQKGTLLMAEPKKDMVIMDVINSFDQIRLLNEAQKLIVESEIRLKKENERVEKAISYGLAIPYDRDKIKLATLELTSKKLDLASKRKVLYQKISVLTHYNNEQIDAVVYEISPIILPKELTADDRAELKALTSFKEAYQYALKKEKGTLLPTIGAFGSYSYGSLFNGKTSVNGPVSGNNYNFKLNEATLYPNLMVGAALKWDIFTGFERKHKIHEAKINIKQVENQLADTREKVDLQLQNFNAQYETLLSQIHIADQREKIAMNNLTTAQKQYTAGLINITERLAAETEIYQVALNKINTIIAQRKVAFETLSSTGNLQAAIQIK